MFLCHGVSSVNKLSLEVITHRLEELFGVIDYPISNGSSADLSSIHLKLFLLSVKEEGC